MSDTARLALKATAELELVGASFVALGEQYVDEALNAPGPDEAWAAILKYHATASVVADLRGKIDARLLEDAMEEDDA